MKWEVLEWEDNMKKILFCMIALCLCACVETKEKSESEPIGEYVYLDTQGILHVKENCVMGLKVANENGERGYKGVYRIDATSLNKSDLVNIPTCSWCVKDEHYEQLKALNGYYN